MTFFVEAACNLEAADTHERLAALLDELDRKDEASAERVKATALRRIASAEAATQGEDAPSAG